MNAWIKTLAPALGAVLLAAAPVHAVAASAFGTLTFDQPNGIVGPNDVIPINVTLTLDPTSVAIIVSDYVLLSGLDEADLIDAGFDVSQPYNAGISGFFLCEASFAPGCDGPPFDFDFDFTDAPFNLQNFTLNPGESYSFAFGRFIPQVGGAPAGNYTQLELGLAFSASGIDANGDQIDLYQSFATTCAGDPDCAFRRTVTAVPEPGTWALMIAGFGFTGAVLRRRSRAVVA